MRNAVIAAALLAVAGCGGTESEPTAPTQAEQKFSAKGVDVVLTSVEQTDQIDPVLPAAGEGETFVVAKYSLTNTSSKPLSFTERPLFELVDEKGQAYEQDVMTSSFVATQADPTGFANGTNPGTTTKMGAVWKVAKKSYDPSKWKIIVKTKPAHEFKLN